MRNGWRAARLVVLAPALASIGFAHAAGAPEIPPQEVRIIGESGEVAKRKPASEVEAYCLNIADEAQDARYAQEQKQLTELEAEIGKQIDALEAKRKDYQQWLEERKSFLESASTIIVDIYAKMKADAAAAQLAQIDRSSAASLIARLKSRQASDILSAMPPATAAEITNLIVQKTSTGGSMDEKQVAERKP
ncbi:MotE family protein [Aurantimonas marianensis]|uniref:MotE family protein n=1 Tax=Aurantimonas marianensis TaxID=2920428 RepID=A0A9X2H5E0_9HYPH|nr:MotE family protein [Aurantimonas marianensis]MCP3055950.1 MotE family protein [Aurantimonas marianensis]